MPFRDFAIMLAVCLVWAAQNIISRSVVTTMGVPPLFYAAVRFAVVALVTFPFLRPAPRPLWRLIVVSLLMGGGNFALIFVGLKTATPSSAAVVQQLGLPITTLLSVVMLGERIRWRRGLGILLTFAGAMTVMWDPHGVRLSGGLMLIAVSAAVSSLGAVMMKQMEGVKPLTFQAWVGLSSLVALTPMSAALEPGQVQAGLAAGWPFAAAVLFSALVVSVVAHTAYYGLIQRHEANLISALTLMTPLFTISLGVALLHDPFGPRMAIGTAVAMTGVLIIALRGNRVMAKLMALGTKPQ
ncbi:MAG: DMT family transporter [Caulobacterales bacterium]|nr:DMT family transporter [Caulobacterales bacterium]